MINIEENVLGHPNAKYKDSLFRRVFGAEDTRVILLCSALSKTSGKY